MKNLAASVRARLLNLSKKEGRDYNRLTLLYLQERFLARLSASPYKEKFVLKGGLYLYSRYGVAARATRDMDLLGQNVPSTLEDIAGIIAEIAAPRLEDGVLFDATTIKAQAIKEGAEYEGVRVSFLAKLGSLRLPLSLDIGFGDKVNPAPRLLEFPVLLTLPQLSTPQIFAYSIETVIAEKLQAMAFLGYQNSRAKDFYDLFYASRTETLQAETLSKTIRTTFAHRATPLEDALKVLDPSFAQAAYPQKAWVAFRKANPELVVTNDFAEVIHQLTLFLKPVITNEVVGIWQPSSKVWSEVMG
jgi:predicted nucleotidyltransferase component of viral defense system